MPIYEYYSPDNNRIYQFFAKTLAQGATMPKCPDNPGFRMVKMLSSFSVVGARPEGNAGPGSPEPATGSDPGDARIEAAMGAMEGEFSGMDENDPRAMGRMMRRMAELTGGNLGGMEEVVRKLEEGADPESLEDQFEADDGPREDGPPGQALRPKGRVRRGAPARDPRLYDYPP